MLIVIVITHMCVCIYIYIYESNNNNNNNDTTNHDTDNDTSLRQSRPAKVAHPRAPRSHLYRCLRKNTFLVGEPLPGNPSAEAAIQPLIWCSENPCSY